MAVPQSIINQTNDFNKANAGPTTTTGSGKATLSTNTSYKSPVPDFSGHGLDLSTPQTPGMTGNIVNPQVPKPTTVVSAKTATNGPVTAAKTVVNNPPTQPLYNVTNGFVTPYGLSQGAKPVQPGDPAMQTTTNGGTTGGTGGSITGGTSGGSSKTTQTSTPGNQTPEDTINHDGDSLYYSQQTGQTEWVPTPANGQPPAGYSLNNPITTPGTDSVSLSNGSNYKQMADGTYSKFNPTTNTYSLINAGEYNTAKSIATTEQKANNLINSGTFSPDQQSQIDGITAAYAKTIQQQTDINNGAAGVAGVWAARGGAGVASSAGDVQKVVQDGLDKITALQTQEASDIAKMKAGFLSDDTQAVKDAWDSYNNSQQETQKQIDAMTAATTKAAATLQTNQDRTNMAMSTKYGVDIPPGSTYQQMKDALASSPKYVSDTAATASLTDDAKEFWASNSLIPGGTPDLPSRMSQDEKTRVMQQIADNAKVLGKTGSDVGRDIVDSTAKVKSINDLANQEGELESGDAGVKTMFKNVLIPAANKVPNSVWQSGIPALQNLINTGTMGTTNNPQLTAFLGALQTTLTSYAKVVSGATGKGGVPISINDEVSKILSGGLNSKNIEYYINNIAIPEMDARVAGFTTTKNSYIDGLNVADGSLQSSQSPAATGTTSTQSTVPATANTIW